MLGAKIYDDGTARRMRHKNAHLEKSFQNLIKSIRNQIVFTTSPLILNQTDVHLVPNQSESGEYNLISDWFNKIFKIFFWVQRRCSSVVSSVHCCAREFGSDFHHNQAWEILPYKLSCRALQDIHLIIYHDYKYVHSCVSSLAFFLFLSCCHGTTT